VANRLPNATETIDKLLTILYNIDNPKPFAGLLACGDFRCADVAAVICGGESGGRALIENLVG
jgi:hypothetical protein